MAEDKVYDESSTVKAEGGAVHVDGPDSVDVKLTPQAAEEIADQLVKGAVEAQGQRYFDEASKRPKAD